MNWLAEPNEKKSRHSPVLIHSGCVCEVNRMWALTHTHTNPNAHKDLIFLALNISLSSGAFVICWTPGLVILLLDGLECTGCQVLKYEKYCLVLAECNSLVNPIIYSCRDEDMRNTFKRILCFLCRRDREQEVEPGAIHSDTLKSERLLMEKCSDNYNHNHRERSSSWTLGLVKKAARLECTVSECVLLWTAQGTCKCSGWFDLYASHPSSCLCNKFLFALDIQDLRLSVV